MDPALDPNLGPPIGLIPVFVSYYSNWTNCAGYYGAVHVGWVVAIARALGIGLTTNSSFYTIHLAEPLVKAVLPVVLDLIVEAGMQ